MKIKREKRQPVIEMNVGQVAWVSLWIRFILLLLVITAACQRFKARILRRDADKLFISCYPAGFVPVGGVLSIAQAAEVTKAAVEKGLTSYKRATDPKLLDLVDKNVRLESDYRRQLRETVSLREENHRLLKDCRENQKFVKVYRERDKTDRKDLVQEIAELTVVLDRASAANKKLKAELAKRPPAPYSDVRNGN